MSISTVGRQITARLDSSAVQRLRDARIHDGSAPTGTSRLRGHEAARPRRRRADAAAHRTGDGVHLRRPGGQARRRRRRRIRRGGDLRARLRRVVLSAAEVRDRCADLGLSIDLYQPFRDFDSARPEILQANLRRADRKFDVMEQLGTDLILVCSSVAPDALDDDDRIAEQLHQLAARAQERGLRVSYEALAWGTLREHLRAVLGHRPARRPPGARAVRRQLPHPVPRLRSGRHRDRSPARSCSSCSWPTRRTWTWTCCSGAGTTGCFPGQGTFDLPAFLGHVLTAGYTGPLSLEVFNDVFRQSEPAAGRGGRAAVPARAAGIHPRPLPCRSRRPDPQAPTRRAAARRRSRRLGGFAFAELAVDADSGRRSRARWPRSVSPLGAAPDQAGAAVAAGRRAGAAELLAGTDEQPTGAAVAALGVETADPGQAPRPARRRCWRRCCRGARARPRPTCPRSPRPTEHRCSSAGPVPTTDQLALGLPRRRRCRQRRGTGQPASTAHRSRRAHPAVRPVRRGGAVLPLGAGPADPAQLGDRRTVRAGPQPRGRQPDGAVRVCLSVSVLRRGSEWQPGVTDPQHVAFATDDVFAAARAAAAAGAPILQVPDNYYDDLDARLAPPAELLAAMRELGVLLRPQRRRRVPALVHRGAGRAGVLRSRAADRRLPGYGESNSPIRMAAHRRQRTAARHPASAPRDGHVSRWRTAASETELRTPRSSNGRVVSPPDRYRRAPSHRRDRRRPSSAGAKGHGHQHPADV